MQISLRVRSYLSDLLPPLAYIPPVRCLVLRDDRILVSRNAHRMHIVPGGRRELGESLEETLRREVLEETGWQVTDAARLGFMHFHHLNPRPPDYAYPYPDFIQLIYRAQAERYQPEAKIADDYEVRAWFHPLAQARARAHRQRAALP